VLNQIPDLVVGVLFFTAFLVLAVVAGGHLNANKKKSHLRALAPLAAYIGGAVAGNEYSAWITGTFRNRGVTAKMTPGRNISNSSDYTIRINSFEITLSDVPGMQSWEIAHQGVLRKKWELKAQDESLKTRLSQSRLVSDLGRIGNHPSLR
jgi:hypothetical protein